MNRLHNKTNKIKHLPTEFSFYYHIDKQLKKLKKQENISRLLIIVLIIWDVITSLNVMQYIQIPYFTDRENELIMQLEELTER